MPVKPRRFPTPDKVRAEILAEELTLDEMELVASMGLPAASPWAFKVLVSENRRLLDTVLGAETRLPLGLLAAGGEADGAVVALAAGSKVWDSEGWDDEGDLSVHGDHSDSLCVGCENEFTESPADGVCPMCGAHMSTGKTTIQLTEEDVAAFIRTILEGADTMLLRPFQPVARLDQPMMAAAEGAGNDLPEGAVPIAVVDELDKTAVLELIAVAPGPKVYLRNRGMWVENTEWLNQIKSLSPPPVVKLDGATLGAVVTQVDQYDAGETGEEPEDATAVEEEPVAASGYFESGVPYFDEIQQESLQMAADFVLTAASAASKVASKAANKAAGAERLRQYWGYGKGAAKIRWGTPGDWTRCYKYTKKFMGVRAKGYCSLMHARVTGAWSGSKGVNALPNPAVSAEAIAKQLSK